VRVCVCVCACRSHLDTSGELRFSLGSLAETQSDHYRSAKVIRRPQRGRVGLRESKVSSLSRSLSLSLALSYRNVNTYISCVISPVIGPSRRKS